MSTAYTSADEHLIEQRGENSYWVLRYEKNPQFSRESFSRVVFFARSKKDAETYIRRCTHPQH